tara:strand:+ start:310 stop:1293 length:984 start_codon:yes stop_codon:yes gene_type:complete
MNPIHTFYGDQTRWFVGVIEEVGTDKPKLGRVRVRIYGIHGYSTEVPISDLPQAQVLVPTTEPGVSGMGRNPYLEVGATVFGIFLDGKASQLPLVLGSIPTVEVPSAEQLANAAAEGVENAVLSPANRINKTGSRTTDNNTATIKSTLAGGHDTQYPDGGEPYPKELSARVQMAWEWFTSNGWTNHQAAGIIGNLYAESGLKPSAKGDIGLHAPKDVSIGIAQWYNGSGNRVPNLIQFAKERGKTWSDFRIQLAFVQHELDGAESRAGGLLRKTTNPTSAALVFRRAYERPEKTGGRSQYDGKPERLGEKHAVEFAIKTYNTYTRTA